MQLPGAIGLPLALQIGEVYGRDLRIRPAAGEPLIIDSVQLGLHSEEARLVLDRFEVSAPQGLSSCTAT
ncbi:hypothetical protein [Marinobacterium aestuariivivens]|uniref:Uncharacterized protein n=1 Tax=Marinobacterium aestuariivivens TaxID=1698799 RepID=A0ABW2A231_9GAMM